MGEAGVKSAQRAMELLEFFADCRRPASIKEISLTLGYPQSSTSVLLRALVNAGYYDHDPLAGTYQPSVRILLSAEWIGEHLFNERSLLRLMDSVLAETGYTVMIGTQHGSHVRYLHVLQSTREGRFIAKSGALRPLFRSAAGKMLLTLKPEREVSLLLRRANGLEKHAAQCLELATVTQDLEAVRRTGYAVSLGTAQAGAAALAILLPLPRGQKPLTLSIGGPLQEVQHHRRKLVTVLRRAVEHLGRPAG